ncbi:hypothetical protein C2G38_2180743 [Gigaspora rosea]|uniref:Ion transport domain-containing protein n=1 Tax=Gigaspora rosea TaxID=44941 RepID=A0A397VBL6_9GLOM|nr:hypothetical protein C2G38_2180743 [Gigaspora rosea]
MSQIAFALVELEKYNKNLRATEKFLLKINLLPYKFYEILRFQSILWNLYLSKKNHPKIYKYLISPYLFYLSHFTNNPQKTICLIFPLLNFATYSQNYSYYELFYLHDNSFTSLDNSDYYKWWNIKALINVKWNTYGNQYYFLIWTVYSIFMCCFLIVLTISKDEISWNYQVILLIVTIFLGLFHFIFEVRQFIHKPMHYIISPWNWFGILVLAFAHSLHILLRPTTEYSYNQPSYTKDINNSWNLVLTYQFISSNGTVDGSSLVEISDDNTNMFAQFSTSLLAVYFMLTGDSSAVSSWVYKNNWMLVFLIVIFLFFTTIYLLNLFTLLLGNAVEETNNKESFLKLKCKILSEIELFWMLPYQRRKKNWFPDILYYEASVDELKKYINNIKDDEEIFQNLLPAVKEIVEIKDTDNEIKDMIKAQNR